MKKPFKFQVKRGDTVLYSTEYRECLPDKTARTTMKKAGYKLYLNGKPFKEADLK